MLPLVILTTVLLLALPGTALAQEPGPAEATDAADTIVPSLPETLESLLSVAVVGGVIAYAFERFQWFQNIGGGARAWIVAGLSFGIPMVATLLLEYIPANVWTVLEPFWRAIYIGGAGWLASQVAHSYDRGDEIIIEDAAS
jgi:hypothetical protein